MTKHNPFLKEQQKK